MASPQLMPESFDAYGAILKPPVSACFLSAHLYKTAPRISGTRGAPGYNSGKRTEFTRCGVLS
jgi:hypothetical protein